MSTTSVELLSDEQLFERAGEAEESAEKKEAEVGSSDRWSAADDYAELHSRGYSTRDIGKRVGKSHGHIAWCIKAAAVKLLDRGLFADAYREAGAQGKNGARVEHSSESDEWATPQDLFDVLNAEFDFELDVCATSDNAKCERYFTQEDDGLAQEWRGVCWMNPPYSETDEWIQKAHDAAKDGAIVVALVGSRTDTGWFHDCHARAEVRFLRGRLRFEGSENSAPFPSVVMIFRPEGVHEMRCWDWR